MKEHGWFYEFDCNFTMWGIAIAFFLEGERKAIGIVFGCLVLSFGYK